MPINVQCVCGTRSEADDARAGQMIDCPGCGGRLAVPAAPTAPGRGGPRGGNRVAIAAVGGVVVLLGLLYVFVLRGSDPGASAARQVAPAAEPTDPETRRKREIFQSLHEAEMLAGFEAESKAPTSSMLSGKEFEDVQARHRAAFEAALPERRRAVLERFGIDEPTAAAIQKEGKKAYWPIRDPEDPFRGKPAPAAEKAGDGS